jgi:hypothetical protein
LITGKLEEGLAERISSFAEGFLNMFFDAFEGKEGILGGFADVLRGPDNAEKDSFAAAGSSAFTAVNEGGAGGAAEAATTGLGLFAEKVMTSAAGLGDWASQALTSIAQFFGLSLATQSQTTTSTLAATQTGILSGAFALLTVAANSLATALATAAASSAASGASSIAGSMFGFATGGAVNGPGTGTSDSIMAMLSNGEYVINAASTKKFRPILEAINSGNMDMPAFADGGAVDLRGASNKVMKDVAGRPGAGSGQQTTVNLAITGDISRQTKKEILSMMPSIAQGVNQQNKEQNR